MAGPTVQARRLAVQDVALPVGASPSGTRGTILVGALRLFAERGFAGTSIRDIAASAGVQSATLYGHYPSKEHILAEISEIGHREHHGRLSTALLESNPDPVHQLTALTRAHVLMHAEYAMLAIVANVELHMLSPDLGAPSFALRERSEELFHDVIARGISLGDFDPPDQWMTVAAIAGMGVRVANWYSPDRGVTPEQVADTYAEFARRIVGASHRQTPTHP